MTAADVRSSRSLDDRRTQRTRAALLSTFREMILSGGGYDAITPRTLAAAANVGRSTFYEHFSSVDDLLACSIGGLLAPLASSITGPEVHPRTVGIVQHFWDHRKMTRAMLTGGGHRVVAERFTEEIAVGLAALASGDRAATPPVSPKLAAAYLAAGALALLAEWLSGRSSSTAAEIAGVMHAAGFAGTLAFSGGAARDFREPRSC